MMKSNRVIVDSKFSLPSIPIMCYQHQGVDISHEGKSKHVVSVSFSVLDPNKKISFYHLNVDEFESYAFRANSLGSDFEPKNPLFKLSKVSNCKNYEISITETTRLHFMFAKTGTSVPLQLTIVESWESDTGIVKVLPGIPITDNQLSKRIKQLIHESTHTLKIISPHTDLHLMDDISDAIKRNVEVRLIIRNEDQYNTHTTKQAYPHLQKILGKNLKSNEKIHSRLIIKDSDLAIVMSSDIDQNSMQNLINCGMEISDSLPITELNRFFEEIWRQSKNTS